MNKLKTKQLVVDAMLIALLVVSSFISIPINQVPVTLQTLMVYILLLVFSFRDSLIVLVMYLIMGLCGLPVFSGFSSGITPTLGFILGFVISVFIYHILKKVIKIKNETIKEIIGLFACVITINLIGSIYFMIYFKHTFIEAMSLTIFPFILFDIIKMCIAIILGSRLKVILNEEK
jgi:biotin transport system substrate-specific component